VNLTGMNHGESNHYKKHQCRVETILVCFVSPDRPIGTEKILDKPEDASTHYNGAGEIDSVKMLFPWYFGRDCGLLQDSPVKDYRCHNEKAKRDYLGGKTDIDDDFCGIKVALGLGVGIVSGQHHGT
jgi:hypothetical protein